MTIENIPIEIRPYLLEISERLWTGHASVMVGAGFSKNAINTRNSNIGLPSWNQLGDIFYEKIHGKKPDVRTNYLNPLKLADEVQAAFGRSVLDQLLKKHIGDKDFEPSDIHIKLLELPWSDVFTTNYDTLLERSCENVISRRYDIVINQRDIIYSNRPRIIKLHGSFPSERPLIITEEDYRTYPKKFAPFVNTVQQSLLENTLCLLGFSGDDPNFLQWIGWINDNIGKENSPKIYLVGVLNISDAQRKLLASKNIVSIDLSICDEINDNHKKAIELFIDFLSSQREKRENLEWPLNQKTLHYSEDSKLDELINYWQSTRLSYPNWVILPQEQREWLWMYTKYFVSDETPFTKLNNFEDLNYIYELNWRLERCLFPIYNNLVFHFQRILNQYNPFPQELSEIREISYNDSQYNEFDWTNLRNKWVAVTLSLLRYYREEDFKPEWKDTCDIISKIFSYLSHEQIALFYNEQILMSIFSSDNGNAKKLLTEWPINSSIPFWEAKRATLLAEFGQMEDAEKILEESLTTIRKRLNLSPVENDYNWVSQEAYVMFLLKVVRQNIRFSRNEYSSDTGTQTFNERWNHLLQYKCDPWIEKKYFDLILQQKYSPPQLKVTKDEFAIGSRTTTYQLSGKDEGAFTAYTFLRYVEELGIPISLQFMNFDTKTISGLMERIMPRSPHWGLSVMNRYRDYEIIDIVFNRRYLVKIDYQQLDAYISDYISKFDQLFPERENNAFANAFIKKVPAILSRLCVKCSESSRIKIFEFYQKIFKLEIRLPQLDKLMKNLISSSNSHFSCRVIPLLLDMPVLSENWAIAQINYPEPFDYLRNVGNNSKIKISNVVLTELFDKVKKLDGFRQRALSRLMFLHTNGILNRQQSDKLFKTIWENRDDQTGFPAKTNYYHFAFINWPQPQDVNVKELYVKYISSNNFNIQSVEKEKGIEINGGSDRYAEELEYGSASINKNDGIKWSEIQLEQILSKCEIWWNADKSYLIEKKYKEDGFGESIYQEFQLRFMHLTNIIARVFSFQRKTIKNNEILKRIAVLILDIEKHTVPVLKAKAAFADIIYISHEEYLTQFQTALISKNNLQIIDALDSSVLIININHYAKEKHFIPELLDLIMQPIKWHIVELMRSCLEVLNKLIKSNSINFENVENCILDTLKYINEQLNISQNDQYNENELLSLRSESVAIAGTMYRKYVENHMEVPIVINQLKRKIEDPNEFGDVANRWD